MWPVSFTDSELSLTHSVINFYDVTMVTTTKVSLHNALSQHALAAIALKAKNLSNQH